MLAAKLKGLAELYSKGDTTLVREAAQLSKATIVAGSPSRLRGVGKRGARLSVRYTLTKTADDPAALVFAVGPWQLIERDTRPHQIPRERRTRSFEGVYGHAVIPGGSEAPPHGPRGVRTRVHHPGTKGKKPWARGVEKATPLVTLLFHRLGEDAIRAWFG
jgi:hypothetical protein